MSNNKNGNLMKLVAFFLICAVLTCTVAFASDGTERNSEDSGKTEDGSPNGDTDNIQNENPQDSTDDGVNQDFPAPKYHYLTGEPTKNTSTSRIPMAFVLDPALSQDCISSCYLMIELPIENGATRLIGLTDDALTLSSIGSFSPSREYFNDVIGFFGAIPLYYGKENGNFTHSSAEINLKECIGYYFTDDEGGIFTNSELLSALLIDKGIATVTPNVKTAPFTHNEIDNDPITHPSSAMAVEISYSESNSTYLSYSEETAKYVLSRSGCNIGKNEYKNVFILYTDSVTYEDRDSTSLSLSVGTSGTGLYLTSGTYITVMWHVSDGNLILTNEEGQILTVNRGTSYISYVKSSESHKVTLS